MVECRRSNLTSGISMPVGWHSLFTWHDLAFLSLRSFLCYSSKCAPRASVCPLQATVQTCSKESLAACSSLTSSAASARWRSLRQPLIYQLRHPLFQRRRNQGKIFTHTDQFLLLCQFSKCVKENCIQEQYNCEKLQHFSHLLQQEAGIKCHGIPKKLYWK